MKRLRLRDRDFQLLAILAEARCLSSMQLRRLFFRGSDDTTLRKKMRQLEEGHRALVKRLEWYDRTGVRRAWSLTPAGYVEAERVLEDALDVPRDDIGAEFLEHHVLLAALFVELLAVSVDAAADKAPSGAPRRDAWRGIYARALHPNFRWIVVGNRDLPWRQPSSGKEEKRVLRPDAILELPLSRRRLFIEAEMGTHTIVSASDSKAGATLAKAERYEAFCTLMSGPGTKRTWYAERFDDGFSPEVLFLVRTPVRVRSVSRALEGWRRSHPNSKCAVRVATIEEAVSELLPAVGCAAPAFVTPAVAAEIPGRAESAQPIVMSAGAAAASGLELAPQDVTALEAYFVATQSDFKRRRDLARLQNSSIPEYPQAAKDVHALVRRLRASRG
jgi:hypothetical protein